MQGADERLNMPGLEADSIEDAMTEITEINAVLRPKAPVAGFDTPAANGPSPRVPISPPIRSGT